MKPTVLQTHALKDEGGSRDWLQENKGKQTSPTESQSNNLELRLGISLNTCTTSSNKLVYKYSNMSPSNKFMSTLGHHGLRPSSGGPKRWPPPELRCSGFIHPWSLAARQQKALLEQAHQRSSNGAACSTPATSRLTPPSSPLPIVGWPPVRAYRKNLSGLNPIKPDMDDEKDAKKAKVEEHEEKKISSTDNAKPTTMFVKVNMEGFGVGRKINLKAHDSYESLSRALHKMFENFLSTHYSTSTQEEQAEDRNSDYIPLYEDHEGDRMLVGDVPWEVFITSVKRLYIAHSPKIPKTDNEKVAADDKK